MEPEFWHQRWAQDQIGFHLSEVNPWLRKFWPAIRATSQARVLVPLCGKSLDLAWLASEGHGVLGVELSHKAVEDFFKGQGIEPVVRHKGTFTIYSHALIELWCGDFFALTAEDVQGCSALYDRAALIALPPPMRQRYTGHLARILPDGCQGLLVTLAYDQSQIEGPPFSVPDLEVRRLLEPGWAVSELQVCDVLGESWKFVQRGVTRLDERVYQLSRRADLPGR